MPYINQLDTAKWIKGIARPIAWIRFTPRELCLSHGIQFDYHEGGWGLGDLEMALLKTRSGRPFGLERYLKVARTDCTAILLDEKMDELTGDLTEVMCDLGLQSTDMLLFDLDLYRFQPCRLIREDDHGNRVVVHEYDCYPDAFFQKEVLEQRGHKQTYSIERGEPKPKGWTGSWVSGIPLDG